MSKFEVGDKVKVVDASYTELLRRGEVLTVTDLDRDILFVVRDGVDEEQAMGMFAYRFALVQPEPAHESDWSYAEAERLQKLAHDAIDAYNEYINAKPNTVFLTIIK